MSMKYKAVAVSLLLSLAILPGCKFSASTAGTVIGGIGSLIGGVVAFVQFAKQDDTAGDKENKTEETDRTVKADSDEQKSADKSPVAAKDSIKDSPPPTIDKGSTEETANAAVPSDAVKVRDEKDGFIINTAVLKSVEYRHFVDENRGFSFDYPYLGLELEQQHPHKSVAFYYEIDLKHGFVRAGYDFGEKMDLIFYRSADDILNKEDKPIDNNGLLRTYLYKPDKTYHVEKQFLVKDDFGNTNRRYIHFSYDQHATEEEKQIGQRMVDSFSPGKG